MAETTADPFRGANLEIAEAIAPTWERRRAEIERVCTPVRGWLLKELQPQPGQTVLELAAGVGDTGFEAAGRIGPSGRLICSDFSPAMLGAARRRAAELGVENVEYRQIDAERIELESESVDAVICRFGFMLMADPAKALAEVRRVLRGGGRLALAVWGAPERNPFFVTAAGSLIRRGHIPPPDPTGPGIFSLADQRRVSTLLHDAGFADVRTEDVPVTFEVPDVDDYLGTIADTAGPLGLALRGLPDSERAAVRSDAQGVLAGFAADDGLAIPGLALCAVAH